MNDRSPKQPDAPPRVEGAAAWSADPILFRLLAEGFEVKVQVTGGSMSPFIRNLDVVTLAPLGSRRLALGDVVGYSRAGDRLVVHRIVGLRDKSFLARGDAAGRSDGWVGEERIVGQVTRVARRSRLVRLGQGPERHLIAWLSGHGALIPLLRPVRWVAKQARAGRSRERTARRTSDRLVGDRTSRHESSTSCPDRCADRSTAAL